MEIATGRLRLRPLRMSDVAAVQAAIFEDPEVAKGLAHDISRPGAPRGFAAQWCGDLGVDGANDIWPRGGIGAFAITSGGGALGAPGAFLGVAGIYDPELRDGRWHGELFYALGRAHHGMGVMTEACAAILGAFRALPNAGDLYAVYWELLNPASGRVLRRLGFARTGSRTLLDEYGAARARTLGDFELWRVQEAMDLSRVLPEAATKLGHLAHEGLLGRGEALDALREAVGRRMDDAAFDEAARPAFDRGAAAPGYAYLSLPRA